MVPTYFRRELRDRALQRPSRLRTFIRMSDHPLSQQKSKWRAEALAARQELDPEQRILGAKALARHDLPFEISHGSVVAGYWPIRGEIDPQPLMEKFATSGARLALPVIIGRDQPLVFRMWSRGDSLRRGPLGISEPMPEKPELSPDLLLVPLAAFDRSGHRIGYGAGHYDRTLEALRRQKAVITIGLAFAVQEIPKVPAMLHDVMLDYVLTDTRLFDCRSS